MKNIIDALNWRYATKEFDKDKKLSPEQLHTVTEALRLSASSFGLQPWKFIVVTNQEIRAKLKEVAWGQNQITDASHLIVLATQKNVDAAFVDKYVADVSATRGVPVENLKGYADMMKGSIGARTPEQVSQWAAKQTYIALGTAMAAAALEGIDSCPMEGFDSAKFDEILGLAALGLESSVLLPVGFRAASDATAAYKKVRFAEKDVIVEVK